MYFSPNKILSFYSEAKKLLKGNITVPRMVSVWLSQVCNLRCSHCLFTDYNKEVNKFIDTDKFKDFISEIGRAHV